MWSSMNNPRRGDVLAALAIAIAAASTTYLFDSRSGRRRRALLRDRASRLTHQAREFVGKAGRDARQRAHGAYEKSVSRWRGGPIDAEVLRERVRAELGRLSSHPRAIEVACSRGTVRLRGDILEQELEKVLRGVQRVRGVEEVVNELQPHADAGRIPALQGHGTERRLQRFEYLQSNWSPAPRLLAGAAGCAMIMAGLSRRSAPGSLLALAGIALLGRSAGNAPLSHLLGVRADVHDGVLVQRTIEIYAEVEEVYARWRALEDFPSFMAHVLEVSRLDDTHYHWKVEGPAGVPIEWDAEITADVPGELIAWRTTDAASVRSSGIVQFEPTAYGATRVHVRLSYRPPANLAGHAFAKALRRDPQRQIEEDLMRFKSYVETGRPAQREAAQAAAGEPVERPREQGAAEPAVAAHIARPSQTRH